MPGSKDAERDKTETEGAEMPRVRASNERVRPIDGLCEQVMPDGSAVLRVCGVMVPGLTGADVARMVAKALDIDHSHAPDADLMRAARPWLDADAADVRQARLDAEVYDSDLLADAPRGGVPKSWE